MCFPLLPENPHHGERTEERSKTRFARRGFDECIFFVYNPDAMSAITVKLSFEQLLEAARSLSEEEQERLIFELSPELRQALQAMEAEYDRDRASGKTTYLEDL